MKILNRILIIVCCLAILLISWLIALTTESDEDKQEKLIEQAEAYLDDEIYVLSVPLLEEAISYKTERTDYAEQLLKSTCLELINQQEYRNIYEELLDRQMGREGVSYNVFLEAAEYYLQISDKEKAFSVLRLGIDKTGNDDLIRIYEDNRYGYVISRTAYEDVTATYNGAITVQKNGLWGLASSTGRLTLPCMYDEISTYESGRAVVRIGDLVYAVDSANNRVALLHEDGKAVTNYGQNRIAVLINGEYVLGTGTLEMSSRKFESIGMYSNNYAAAKKDGKWGVLGLNGQTWLIEPSYKDIIRDELGRCFAQNAVFVVDDNDSVLLLVNGEKVGSYEDARPFADGWAAVKKDGKWGFIDVNGEVMIPFRFDDALSFSGHLAAVKVGDLWGYVSLLGEVVIEPVFMDARSFYNGAAPVKTEEGWQFISLEEKN